ncbi:MAG: response regulator [Sulfuricurvum sp.]
MSKSLTVLAVDDEPINLRLLRSMLLKLTNVQEVIEARDGKEAVDIVRSRDDIDIILLDILMPIMNGTEVIKVLRSDSSIRQLPIIVLTTDETKKQESLELGANDFLVKPIRKDELVTKLEAMVLN